MKKIMFAASAICAAVVFCSCSDKTAEAPAAAAEKPVVEKVADAVDTAEKVVADAAGTAEKVVADAAETAEKVVADAADATEKPAADAAEATEKPAAGATEKTFTVGFDAEFPPYGFKDGDTFKGFDLDLAREVCKRLGWKFVAKPIDWDAKDAELDSGSIDCIWNGFTMQGREDSYTWTPAYIDNSQVVLVAADSAIAKLADLKDKNVAVQTDTPVQKALQGKDEDNAAAGELGKTFKQIVVCPTYNNAVMELEAGAVDAVALDVGVAKQKMADKAGKFKMLDEIIMKETYGIGFKKGNKDLADTVWATYQAMLKDGFVDKLAEEYKIDVANIIK